MQMRSSAWWVSVSVVAMFALTNSAWAAPKKKSKAAKPADTAEAAPVEPEKTKAVDDLMQDSTKKKADRPAAKPSSDSESEPAAEVGEPDAWERPPAEEEKPNKHRKAEPPPEAVKGDGHNINIGILAGYGFSLGGGLTSVNPYSFGVGLQGDYELESHIVLGVGGEFFIGEQDSTALDPTTRVNTPTYARYILGHALVGYNFWFGQNIVLRPSIWVGVAIALRPADITGSTTAFGALLAPGLSFHYLLGGSGAWYLGVDARFSVPLGHETKSGLPILVTFGKRF
jgi:hypothetical protein